MKSVFLHESNFTQKVSFIKKLCYVFLVITTNHRPQPQRRGAIVGAGTNTQGPQTATLQRSTRHATNAKFAVVKASPPAAFQPSGGPRRPKQRETLFGAFTINRQKTKVVNTHHQNKELTLPPERPRGRARSPPSPSTAVTDRLWNPVT